MYVYYIYTHIERETVNRCICTLAHVYTWLFFPRDNDTSVTINPLSTQILAGKYSYTKKEQNLCGEGVIQGWDREGCKVNLEYLIVPQSNEMLKKWWKQKSAWTQLPVGQS